MKTTFRKSMIWLHTYTGLLGGWLLFAIFLTGTLSYYNQEITLWMSNSKVNEYSQTELLTHSLTVLQQKAPDASRWQIQLPDERGGQYRATYRLSGKRNTLYFDVGDLTQRDNLQTQGGNFFRTFHYTLSLRNWGGRYFTGIAAMLMLIGVFTGIYTHRRFFKDFFTIRCSDKRKFLIDFHAIAGVVTIPFCFMISVSALLIYINMYQPFAISHYFDSYRSLDREVSTRYQTPEKHHVSADVVTDPAIFWPHMTARWGEHFKLSSLTVIHPNDSNAQYTFTRQKQQLLSNKAHSMAFTRLGHALPDMENERTARMVRRVFYGLHEAHFAEPMLRATLFVLGMISSLLISTGMIVWLNKRAMKAQKQSYVFTEKLNLAAFYGLSIAIGGYFLVNKLALFGISLAKYDQTLFFSFWLICLIFSLLRPLTVAKPQLVVGNLVLFTVLLVLDVFSISQQWVLNNELPNFAYLTISFWILVTVCYFAWQCRAIKGRAYVAEGVPC